VTLLKANYAEFSHAALRDNALSDDLFRRAIALDAGGI
jgi:hypothetical protein